MYQQRLREKIFDYLSLETDLDKPDIIHSTIQKDIIFKGTNLWILGFATIVASVGLNMNSTAVIIGAMLISPLMGPINGMGYSIATYDLTLFRKALKNFGFAVAASLTASTAYFTLSPISTAHSELLARTSPSIYDVLIALFGGLAGIVAISSKHKGNVIPGVAIATALMPPLCTAGYGLATFELTYFFGAMYLFLINSVFIALASVIISQILKFPIRTIPDIKQRRRINQGISLVITLVLIPSIYFGYLLVVKERFHENANKYVSSIRVIEGNYLLDKHIDANKKEIQLVYGGPTLTENQKLLIKDKAADFGIKEVTVNFRQGLSIDGFGSGEIVQNLNQQITRLMSDLSLKNSIIDSLAMHDGEGEQILKELSALYPEVRKLSYQDSRIFSSESGVERVVHIVVIFAEAPGLEAAERTRIEVWLMARLQSDDIMVFYEQSD